MLISFLYDYNSRIKKVFCMHRCPVSVSSLHCRVWSASLAVRIIS
jgi:hypothetical protein